MWIFGLISDYEYIDEATVRDLKLKHPPPLPGRNTPTLRDPDKNSHTVSQATERYVADTRKDRSICDNGPIKTGYLPKVYNEYTPECRAKGGVSVVKTSDMPDNVKRQSTVYEQLNKATMEHTGSLQYIDARV